MKKTIYIDAETLAMYNELLKPKSDKPINYEDMEEIVETWIADFDDGFYVDINVCVGVCGSYWCEVILMKTYADTSGHDVDYIESLHQLDGTYKLHADDNASRLAPAQAELLYCFVKF